jgi:hypothetical protein
LWEVLEIFWPRYHLSRNFIACPKSTKSGAGERVTKVQGRNLTIIPFSLGTDSGDEEEKVGRVKKAKMSIEEKLRKEKRAKIMEDIRKPIILTPGSKRGRNIQEEWEQLQPCGGAESTPGQATPARRGQKMSQTPIRSFLVSETAEERKNKMKRVQKPGATAARATDRSSSVASPNLKRAIKKTEKIKRVPEVTRGIKMSAGKVTLISKMFETASKAPNMTHKQPEQHNHNTVCVMPEFRLETSISAVCSAPSYPEMSSQSGMTAQPIGKQISGHVTPDVAQEPIRDEKQTGPDHVGDDSHLCLGNKPE